MIVPLTLNIQRLPAGVKRLFLAVLLCLAWSVPAMAGGRIEVVSAVPEKGGVRVSVILHGGFPERVVAEIRRGVPKDLFYTLALKRRHRRFFDEEIAAVSVAFTIKFDTLQGRYHIHRVAPDGQETDYQVTTYPEALDVVSHVDDVRIEIPATTKRGVLYATAKAEMRAVQLPMYLDYVLFFIPILEFETPWARSPNLERVR